MAPETPSIESSSFTGKGQCILPYIMAKKNKTMKTKSKRKDRKDRKDLVYQKSNKPKKSEPGFKTYSKHEDNDLSAIESSLKKKIKLFKEKSLHG